MCHRHVLDAVSRTLCDITQDDRPFGGIVTLLAGDFRQILPVVRLGRRRRTEIVDAALSRSPLWQQITVVKLQRNMRVENCARDDDHASLLLQHADWLLQLGDGKLPLTDDGDVKLSPELCVSSVDELTTFAFADLTTHSSGVVWVSSRAILCPRNDTVDAMNNRIMDIFPGDTVTCLSVDTVGEVDQQALYPVEYLNSLNLSGLQPHRLNIKVGVPIMLLRKFGTWTRCEVTAMERDTSCGRSVVGISKQRSRAASTPAMRVVHPADTTVAYTDAGMPFYRLHCVVGSSPSGQRSP